MGSKTTWKPKWSGSDKATYRSLTNIPVSWNITGVELVKGAGSKREIRIYAEKKGDAISAVSVLTGEYPYESLPTKEHSRYDFSIYCRQYDEALVRNIA